MAKTIILAALIFVSISGYTQLVQQDSTIAKATPVDYLKMSKKQKTGGFILLTTSVVFWQKRAVICLTMAAIPVHVF